MPALSNTSVSIERMPSFAIPGSVIITGHDFFFFVKYRWNVRQRAYNFRLPVWKKWQCNLEYSLKTSAVYFLENVHCTPLLNLKYFDYQIIMR